MAKRREIIDQPPVMPAAALTHGLRRFLYLTAAVCGAAVLIVEILGAKMLAPYFGTSHFVWTAQIAVTLISLSAGYYAGGWFVDPHLRPGPAFFRASSRRRFIFA